MVRTKFEVKNYYTEIPKEFLVKAHNPNFHIHGIEVPFRMLIIGASGSGKTNTLMNILMATSGTFDRIIICCKSTEEPFYRFLQQKHKNIQFYENGSVPDISQFEPIDGEGINFDNQLSSSNFHEQKSKTKNKSKVSKASVVPLQTLIVFDDLMTKKDQEDIIEYYIRGRKLGCSMIYLTQAYNKTPKNIRQNCNYFVLKKLANKRDLNLIINDISVEADEVKEIYDMVKETADIKNFTLIDLEKNKARFNFDN